MFDKRPTLPSSKLKLAFAGLLFVCYVAVVPKLALQDDFVQNVKNSTSVAVDITTSLGSEQSFGSGVVVNKDGLILTVAHLFPDEKATIEVRSADKTVSEGKLVKFNKNLDLAMIKVDKVYPTHANLKYDYDFLGQTVYSVSSPERFSGSITKGIMANQSVKANADLDVSLYDLNILPGSSGGGIFDERGQLVGIIRASLSPKSTNNALTVGVKIEDIRKFVIDYYHETGTSKVF
jgi:serine protease Do